MKRLLQIMTLLSVAPLATTALAQTVTFDKASVFPQNINGDSPFLIALEAFYPETCGAQIRTNVTESFIDIELDVSDLQPLADSPCANAENPALNLFNPRSGRDEHITFRSPLTISVFTRVPVLEGASVDSAPTSDGQGSDIKPLYENGGVPGQQFVGSITLEFNDEANKTQPVQAGSWASAAVSGRNVTIDQQGDQVIVILAQNKTDGSAHEFAVGEMNGNVFTGDLRSLDCQPGPGCNIAQSTSVGELNMLVNGYNYLAMNIQRDEFSREERRSFFTDQYSRLRINSSANHTVTPFADSLSMPDLNGTWALHFPDSEEMMVFTLAGTPDSSAYTVTSRTPGTGALNDIVGEQSVVNCVSDKSDAKYGFCVHGGAGVDCSFDFAIADAGTNRIENVAMCRDINGDTQVGTMVRVKN